MTTEPQRRASRQRGALLRASHPRQAVALALAVALLVALMGRPAREVGIAAAAVLVAQLAMGLLNDLLDLEVDRRSMAPGKPVAEGVLPPGNVSFAIWVLLLLALPMSLQNGLQAGLCLLATLPVGYVHNRWLKGTLFSWVGWAATFALLSWFITLGGWGREADGSAPLTTFTVLAAALGVMVHFLTALPDLVTDNEAGVRHLPLRIAVKIGAPRLLWASLLLTLGVVALLVVSALTAGIAR